MCFAAAIALGLAAGNAADTIIWRATVIMVISWPVGYGVGAVAQYVVNRHIEAYKAANPLPDDEIDQTEAEEQAEVDNLGQDQDQGRGDGEPMATTDQRDPELVTAASADV